jgi:hypothetical protein
MRPNTEELIRHLAAEAQPVRRLCEPWVQATVWLACALAYVGLVVVVLAPRTDLLSKLSEPRFAAEAATALGTAVVAAIAAFGTVIPGYSRNALILLIVPLAAWLATLGEGGIRDWVQHGSRGLLLATDWGCFPAILVAGAVPTIAMAVMLRRGAPLTPAVSMGLGGLAAGALADFGLRCHHQATGVMVLVWHLAAVFTLLTIAARAGPSALNWGAVVKDTTHRP